MRRTIGVRLGLGRAYRDLFAANGTKQDADMVLVDLANFSGYYRIAPIGSDGIALARHEGRREVMGRILSHLRQTQVEIDGLEKAVRHEALVDQIEGEL